MAHTMRAVLILVAARSTHALILNKSTRRPTPYHPPRLKAGAHHRPLQPRLDRQFWRLGFS